MKSFRIGDKLVGGGAPVYIVFEAGQTHMGFENARELVTAARDAGADAIKFQIYDSERLLSPELMDTYDVLIDKETDERETVTEPARNSFGRHELTWDQWAALKRHADSLGITFFATVVFPGDVDFMADLGVDVFKIASGDVDHHPFIRYVARKGLPVMLDTGSSTIGEVEQAIDIIRSEGNEEIVVHHCPGGYPAHLDSINLRVINTLRQMLDYPIAFSDHSPGWDMDIAAVTLGVDMVEKTITSDRITRSAEHIMSVEVGETKAFVKSIRDLEVALGNPRRVMTDRERLSKLEKRRSIIAARDLAPGEVITEADIDYRRPGTAISPSLQDLVVGRTLVKQVAKDQALDWQDFQ